MAVIVHKIKVLLRCHSLKDKVRFGRRINIDDKSSFEGFNGLAGDCSFLNSSMGYGSYAANGCYIRNTRIGRFCCIGKNVRIIDVTHPSRGFVSVHPAFFGKKTVVGESFVGEQKFNEFVWLDGEEGVSAEIGSDVWIGDGAAILGGHRIGHGAIVAAGAVVTKDVEPYSIVGGVPARVIGWRFGEEEREWLLSLKWWEKDLSWIKAHADVFESVESLRDSLGKDKAE